MTGNDLKLKKDEVVMNCKHCGYELDEGDNSKYCPSCGAALFDEAADEMNQTDGQDNGSQAVQVENEEEGNTTPSTMEFDEEQDVYERPEEESENTENLEDANVQEPSYTSNPSNTQENGQKGGKGGAIIAAVAAFMVVACVVIVIAVNSIYKKKSDSDKKQTVASSDEQQTNPTNPNASINEGSAQTEVTDGTTLPQGSDQEEAPVKLDIEEFSTENAKLGDYSIYEKYITLGDYKGVEVNMVPTEVTDDQVESNVNQRVSATATTEEVKDRDTVQQGDIANIDYTGYLDGKAFDHGAAKGYDLVIGSGQFIPGFEDGLVGAKVGETKDIDVTFPEDYGDKNMAGKPVTFTVTINSIKTKVDPKLDDKWVADNSDYKTVDEYRASIRKELEDAAAKEVVDHKPDKILDTILSNSKITAYPEGKVEDYISYMKNYYSYYAQMSGTTLEDMVSSYYGMTMDQFNDQMAQLGQYSVGVEMLCYEIAMKENITLTDDEYKKAAETYAKDSGYDSLDAMEEKVGKSVIYDRIITDKVRDFVSDNAVEVND